MAERPKRALLMFRVSPKSLAYIEALAKVNGVNRSEMVRLMLRQATVSPDRKWKLPTSQDMKVDGH